MKKHFILICLASLLFSSCFNAVFYNISQDVYPEPTTVSGVVNSLVRYNVSGKEYLVCAADFGLRYKKADDNFHTQWISYINLPFPLHYYDYQNSIHIGEQIIKVAADSEYLYILSTTYTVEETLGITIPDKVSIYAKKITLDSTTGYWDLSGNWKKIMSGKDSSSGRDYFPFTTDGNYYYSDFNMFCTNSVQNKNRKVFVRSGNPLSKFPSYRTTFYYQLNGLENASKIDITPYDNQNISYINNAAVLNNNLYFFNTQAVTTNETATKDATYIYFGYGNTLMYTDGVTPKIGILNCGTTLSCLAVTKDALLIGRGDYSETLLSNYGGITKTTLTEDGVPGALLTNFSTNAAIQLSTSYLILTLLNTDPSKTELESTLYSSIAFVGSGSSSSAAVNFDNVGLWSYYPIRGNWNRE